MSQAAKLIEHMPAMVNVEIGKGDSWSLAVDFDIDLSGYVIESSITRRDDGSKIALTITETDLALGTFSVDLSIAQAVDLPVGMHAWCIKMGIGTASRTYIAGRFIVASFC